MDLSNEAIAAFATVYEAEFGISLSHDDTRIVAGLFLELCRVLVRPLAGEPGHSEAPLVIL